MNGAPAPRSGTPPDGHTLIMVSVTHSINTTLYNKLPYDSIKSFTPVTPVALLADVIAVHPSVPVKSLREQLASQSADPYRDTPAGFAELIRNDIAKYGKIVRDTGLKVE